MRVIIYGAGGIGGVVGGHLARTGHDVILIGRPGHVKAINERGLKLVTPVGTHILKIPAVTSPAQVSFGPQDVVFLCMKGQDTEAALRDLKAVTDDVPIFCFQNGIRNEEIAVRYFPRVYGVMVRLPAEYLTDGVVVAGSDPPGWFAIGRYPEGTDGLVEAVTKELRTAGFIVKAVPDIMPYKWGKLMLNLGNAVEAITNVTGDAVKPIARTARQEAEEILTMTGVHWVSAKEMDKMWPEVTGLSKGQPSVKQSLNSTWQSLTRKQGTVETDFFNGEVVRLAGKLGKAAPVNEGLVRISTEMATNRKLPGKYTPEQLSKALGLS